MGDTGTITTATGSAGGARHHLRPARSRAATWPGWSRATSSADQEATAIGRRRPARRHPPQPHRHPPAPLGPAGGARRPREAGRLAGRARPAALRLQPLRRRSPPRSCERIEDLANQQVIANDEVRVHEMSQAGGRGDGRHRLLRREVRRRGAGDRGRAPVDGALRWHPRPRPGHHRPHQDPGRELHRRQPAPHRGGHRHGQLRPHPRREGHPRPHRHPPAGVASRRARPGGEAARGAEGAGRPGPPAAQGGRVGTGGRPGVGRGRRGGRGPGRRHHPRRPPRPGPGRPRPARGAGGGAGRRPRGRWCGAGGGRHQGRRTVGLRPHRRPRPAPWGAAAARTRTWPSPADATRAASTRPSTRLAPPPDSRESRGPRPGEASASASP